MKKIIKGKVYDTETAKRLAFWENMADARDPHRVEETLYRKKTGEYFVLGSGGGLTRYAEAVEQNRWTGGERIMPLSYEEATRWAEEHLDGDEYEAIFGAVVEDDSRRNVTYSLTVGTAEKLRRAAAEAGIGLSDYVEQILASQV